MPTRSAVSPERVSDTTAGAIRSATRFITLSSGLIAGPAVSLKGSPTVSPITVAACASECLPPRLPSSTNFLALSQAPPELARKTAMSVPVAMVPARNVPRAPTPEAEADRDRSQHRQQARRAQLAQ